MPASEKVVVVTVHGTGDSADSHVGAKWFQQGSAFSERLLGRLRGRGVEADIIPHLWSGANSAWDRERGANKLAALIRKLHKRYDSVHIIGHSHGGNVANDAAVLLRWGLRGRVKNERIDSLTTVGTPFFNVRTGITQLLAGLMFQFLAWGAAIAFVFTALALAYSVLSPTDTINAHPVWAGVYMVVVGACLWFMLGISAQGIRRILRPRIGARRHMTQWLLIVVFTLLALASSATVLLIGFGVFAEALPLNELLVAIAAALFAAAGAWFFFGVALRAFRRRRDGETTTSIFAIWHDNDEAIAFLQRVEELKLEPFPRGAMFRGSRASAISFGVLSVLFLSIAAPVLLVLGVDVLQLQQLVAAPVDPNAVRQAEAQASESVASLAFMAILIGLWVGPALFTLVYLLFRYVVGGAGEIAVRGSMNRYVGGVLRGIAMGRDGDQVLCNVGPRSHTHPTVEHVLRGECAVRMQQGANGAAGALIEKYRWALFAVGGDSSASLTSLTSDAMTWDSLIHTTYFDQPEVADTIGDYIAQRAQETAQAMASHARPAPFAPAPAPA